MTTSCVQGAIIVTGASGGIGQAVVAELAKKGQGLILVDTSFGDMHPLGGGDDLHQRIVLDLSSSDVGQMLDQKISRSRAIAGLVNIAGIQRIGSLLDSSVDDFDQTFSINVRGAFLVTKWATTRMRADGVRGSVVTISSTSGRMPRVNQGLYCASKAALTQMMRVFGLELASHGIRVNTIAPGSTDTPMVRHMAQTMGFESQVLSGSNSNFRLGIPLQRMATPEDIAQSVAFLLSDQARHITMHELIVDGGGTLGL